MSNIAILVGSVYGAAEEVAEGAQSLFESKGLTAEVFNDTGLQSILDFNPDAWLIVTSTTGSGDVPPNLSDTFDALRSEFPMLDNKKYAVLAMGDSSYGDTYCGAGRQFDELMQELSAKPAVDMLKVDAIETTEPLEFCQAWLQQLADEL